MSQPKALSDEGLHGTATPPVVSLAFFHSSIEPVGWELKKPSCMFLFLLEVNPSIAMPCLLLYITYQRATCMLLRRLDWW